MSYDIYLIDRVTEKVLELPIQHKMIGGIHAAEFNYENNTFSPKPIYEAWLNITFNYSKYYYDAIEKGIYAINNISGIDSIPILESMITNIINKYTKNGKWIITQKEKERYRNKDGNIVTVSEAFENISNYTKEKYIDTTYEGATDNYWKATAANAIIPLKQLITMAKLRPDGIWKIVS